MFALSPTFSPDQILIFCGILFLLGWAHTPRASSSRALWARRFSKCQLKLKPGTPGLYYLPGVKHLNGSSGEARMVVAGACNCVLTISWPPPVLIKQAKKIAADRGSRKLFVCRVYWWFSSFATITVPVSQLLGCIFFTHLPWFWCAVLAVQRIQCKSRVP